MSNELKAEIEALDYIPAELGPILKKMGTVVQDVWMQNNGVYLDADQRKGHKPIAVAETVDMEVRIGSTRYIIGPAEEGKPVVSIPVGMSDKVSNAPVPSDWLVGQFYSALWEAFDGPDVANVFVDRLCEAIDEAAEINPENGRLTIKQANLPPVRHAVDAAGALERLKRVFKSRSAGSPSVNFSIRVEQVKQVEQPAVGASTAEAVMNLLPGRPEIDAQAAFGKLQPKCAVTDCPTEGPLNEDGVCAACVQAMDRREAAAAEAMASEVVEVMDVAENELSYEELEDIELSQQGPHEDNSPEVIRAILRVAVTHDNDENGATWGQVKKSAAHLFNEYAEDTIRAMLDITVDGGLVVKTGARRATRYRWAVSSWAEPSVEMLVEPEEAVVEVKVESTRKDVCRVEECGALLTDADIALSGTDLCTGCFSVQELADFAVEEAKCRKCEKSFDEKDAALAHTNGLCLPCCDEIDRMMVEQDMVTDEAGEMLEMIAKHRECANCNLRGADYITGTPIGERAFCDEDCFLAWSGASDDAEEPKPVENAAFQAVRDALAGIAPPRREGN